MNGQPNKIQMPLEFAQNVIALIGTKTEDRPKRKRTSNPIRICIIDNCGRKTHAGGLCGKHYRRNALYGDSLYERKCYPKNRKIADIKKRFETKFIISSTGCWLWNSEKFKSGYGIFSIRKKLKRAHRIAYTIYKGEIPAGICVLHHCDVPSCVNPDHLFLGTHANNMHDMAVKKRTTSKPLKGESNPGAKLTDDQVREIKRDTRLQRIVAQDYGVHQVLISRIKHRKAWAHI